MRSENLKEAKDKGEGTGRSRDDVTDRDPKMKSDFVRSISRQWWQRLSWQAGGLSWTGLPGPRGQQYPADRYSLELKLPGELVLCLLQLLALLDVLFLQIVDLSLHSLELGKELFELFGLDVYLLLQRGVSLF